MCVWGGTFEGHRKSDSYVESAGNAGRSEMILERPGTVWTGPGLAFHFLKGLTASWKGSGGYRWSSKVSKELTVIEDPSN